MPKDHGLFPKPVVPDVGDLLRKVIPSPLYVPVTVESESAVAVVRALRLVQTTVDLYCPTCKKETPWKTVVAPELPEAYEREKIAATLPTLASTVKGYADPYPWFGDFAITFACGRLPHTAVFYFRANPAPPTDKSKSPLKITKVGQAPSLSDFQVGALKLVDEGTTKAQREDFVRAIHTGAHGFAVAACVYYRRVFESILHDARDEHMQEHDKETWPEFSSANTLEKIKLVSAHLPEFLVEHPQLYKILSLGVHQLSEEECTRELPLLREAIELIIEDRAVRKQKEKNKVRVSKMLQGVLNRTQGTED